MLHLHAFTLDAFNIFLINHLYALHRGYAWASGGTYDIYTYALQHTEYFELSCYEDVTAVERPLRVKYRKSFVQ